VIGSFAASRSICLRCINYSMRLFSMHHHPNASDDASKTTLSTSRYLAIYPPSRLSCMLSSLLCSRPLCNHRRSFVVIVAPLQSPSLQSLPLQSFSLQSLLSSPRESIFAFIVSNSSSRNSLHASKRFRDTNKILCYYLFCRNKNNSK